MDGDPEESIRLELDNIEARIRAQIEPNVRDAMKLVFYLTQEHLSRRQIIEREGWSEERYRFLWRKVSMAMTPNADT